MQGGGFTDQWTFPLDFANREKVSKWAYESMCWMTMKGVVEGRSDKTLDPTGNTTRAEAATMIMRYLSTADK